ncbi:MAG: hypothetical protein WCL39_15965, partial [Armatimonadota bacterium]
MTSLVLTAPVARVLAWTPEVEIFPTVVSASEPDLTVAPDGSIHLVFAGQVGSDSQQHIYYTRWNGTSWASLVNLPGPDLKEQQPDIAVGPDGHVHVVAIYRDCGEVTCPYSVFCWEWNGSGWTGPVPLSPNTGGDDNSCSSAKVAVDKNNDLHVVWAQKGATGGESDIMYKKRQSGIWLPTYNVTNNNGGTSYGSVSCDLAIDKNGSNVHVVWHDDFLNNGFQAYYTKNTDLGTSASWLPGNQWYQLSSGSYGKVPRVWLDKDNRPNIVWIDKFGDWLNHRRQLSDIRLMDRSDFDRIAGELQMSPGALDDLVSQGPHAADELPMLLKALGISETNLARTQPLMVRD